MTLLRSIRRRFRTPPFEDVEREERAFYRYYVRRGMTVLDVGAHVGGLTTLFSKLVGDSGAVHTFEPAAAAFDQLRAAIARERASNVVANRCAVSDRPGIVRLHCYEGPFHAFNTMAVRPLADYGVDAGPVRLEEMEATTLDLYCAANLVTRIDLLKIDVEGAELQVLRGAEALLAARRIGCIAFEFGQATFDMGNSPAEIAALFRDHGYRLSNIVKGARLFPGGGSTRTARFAMHLAMPR
ncbi:MAG: FkbM family methyltransferase [Sphingomicrobium sp.]